ncbi:gamma-glutamyltransferase [Solitalea koreensis]|uniref:Glutathione hydrolase proenzyme n=1 Tax=Solitalea koreensis TaxID=543615 RepID=A0A521AM73_9SPHI|nr:gamma-glutamyltransferase [Solitalea koreensis]SMO35895.1 gamma-glutamyltranspeptidase / glutathione hydrolase [Solitalea koreensis]
MKCWTSFILSILSITLFACVQGQVGQNVSGAYKNGMVVTAHPEASKVGLAILKKGGNAVDAAVAIQFALAVVYPNAGNIAGGGFMVYRSAKGETSALDFREKAPAKASRNMYLDSAGNVITDLSISGHLSTGVPGSVDGMFEAHKKYGKLPWNELVQPAIDLANNGFELTERQANELNRERTDFIKYNAPTNTYFLKKGAWEKGGIVVQSDLAKTLTLIRDKGRDGFYDGEVADLIVKEMQVGKGIVSKKDLKDYHSIWRKPLIGNYKGYEIISMPPPSSGGVALLQLLKMVEPYDLRKLGWNTEKSIQVMVEAERRVYADRAAYLGDPDFYKISLLELLAPAYLKSRMADFSWDEATPSSAVKEGKLSKYQFGPAIMKKESEQTTHFSIVDREGNAVAITTTLNNSYGSKVFVQGGGFLLNDEMDDFSIKPGVPNMYGLVGGEANAIQPGKRMLSSMTPTIVEKDGDLFMVLGTPGGSTIITTVFQIIVNVIDHDVDMQTAVDAGRVHNQWLPDTVFYEKKGIDSLVLRSLERKGYHFKSRNAMGRVDAILKTKWDYLDPGADKRGDDSAMGW